MLSTATFAAEHNNDTAFKFDLHKEHEDASSGLNID